MTKNISVSLISNLWQALLLFLLTPLYLKLLGIESYGLIGFYLSWVTIIGIIDTGLSATTSREIAWLSSNAQTSKEIPSLLRSIEIIYWIGIICLGFGLFILAWIFGNQWFKSLIISPEIVRQVLILMIFSLVVQIPNGLYISGLMGLQQQVKSSLVLMVFGSFRGIGAVLIIWLIAPDIRFFFLWQIFISLIQTLVSRQILWKNFSKQGVKIKFSIHAIKSIKGYASGLILITAGGVLISQSDKLVLSHYVPLEVLGYYMLASTVASSLSRITTPLIQVFGPHYTTLLARNDNEGLLVDFHLTSKLLNVLIFPPAAIIFFMAEPILTIWTSSKIVANNSYEFLMCLTIGMAFLSCSYPAMTILYSNKKLELILKVTISSLIIFIPILMIAIINFSAIGASICWAIYGVIIYMVYQKAALKELEVVNINNVLFSDLYAPFFISVLVSLIFTQLLKLTNNTYYSFLIIGIGLLLSWFISLIACKQLREIFNKKINEAINWRI